MVVMFFVEWSTGFCVDYEKKKQRVTQHKNLLSNGDKKGNHAKIQRKPRFWKKTVCPSRGIAWKTRHKTYGATKNL
jgi:hypothetical protein